MVLGRGLLRVEEYKLVVRSFGNDRETHFKATYDLLTGLKGRLSPSGSICQGHLRDTTVSINFVRSLQSLQITHAWAFLKIKVLRSINQLEPILQMNMGAKV